MPDIIGLGLSVDSTQLKQANAALDDTARASKGADDSSQKFLHTFKEIEDATGKTRASVAIANLALKDTSDTSDKAAAAAEKLAQKMQELNDNGFRQAQLGAMKLEEQMKSLKENQMDNFAKSLEQIGSQGGLLGLFKGALEAIVSPAGLVATGILAISGAMIEMSINAAKNTNDLRIQAQVAGTSIDNFKVLSVVTEEIGLGADTAARFISLMNRNIADSADPASKAAYVFKQFGINATDGADALVQLLHGVENLPEPSKLAALSDAFNPRFARELLPLTKDIGEQLEHAQHIIEETGSRPSDDLIEKAKLWKQTTTELGQAWEGVENTIGGKLLPSLTAILSLVSKISEYHFKDLVVSIANSEGSTTGLPTTDTPDKIDTSAMSPLTLHPGQSHQITSFTPFKQVDKGAGNTAELITSIDALNQAYNKLSGDDGGMSEFEKEYDKVQALQANGKIVNQAQVAQLYDIAIKLDLARKSQADYTAQVEANTVAYKEWLAQGKELQTVQDSYQKSLDSATAALQKQTDKQEAALTKKREEKEILTQVGTAYKDLVPFIEQYNQDELALTALQAKANDLQLTNAQSTAATVAAMDSQISSLKGIRDAYDPLLTDTKDYADLTESINVLETARNNTINPATLKALNDQIAILKTKVGIDKQNIDLVKQDIDQSQTWAAGWQKAYVDYENSATGAKAAQDLFNKGTSAMEQLIVDFASKASGSFKTFVASMTTAIEQFLAKQAVAEFFKLLQGGSSFTIQNLIGGGSSPTSAAGGLGNSLGNLFSPGSSSGLGSSLSGIGTSLFGASDFTAAAAGDAFLPAALGAAGEGAVSLGASMGALATSLGSMIPYVGIAIAAFTLISSIFDKAHGPKSGGFAQTDGFAAGGDNNRFFTPSDQDSSLQTTVAAISKGFTDTLKTLGGTGTASFGLGLDTDPKGTANSRTSVGVQVGGQDVFSQRDLDTGGRDDASLQAALQTASQRAILAALQASDLPDYIAKLLNGVDAASATSDQITAIIATAEALKQAVDTVSGLGDQFKNLDPTAIQGLVDAFGDLSTFTSAFKFLGANFTTNAQQIKTAQGQLDDGFGKLNLAIPQTTSQFMDLLGGLDLNTDAGRQTYASLVALAPQFVAVSGTAQNLADALKGFDQLQGLSNDQLGNISQAFGGQAAMITALTNVNNAFTTTAQKVAVDNTLINSTFATLGLAVPSSTAALGELIDGIDKTTPAGAALYAALINLVPAFVEVHDTAQAAADAADQQAKANQQLVDTAQQYFNSNFFSTTQGAAEHLANETQQIADASARLGVTIPTTIDGFREMINAMVAAGQTGTDLYNALIQLGPIVHDIASTINSIQPVDHSGTVGDPQAVADSVQAFLSSIATLAGNIPNADFGKQLGFQIDLVNQKIAEFQAKGAIFAASGNFDYATNIANQVKVLQSQNSKFADELGRYTILTAQYGSTIATQLVQLQDSYAQQVDALSQTVGGLPENAAALAALKDVFGQQWAAIVAGTSTGVNGTLDALQKLKDGIAQYLQSLNTGSLSPATPLEKLAQAKANYDAEFQKALAGDQTALGDISKYADTFLTLDRAAFASSQKYTDDFNNITGELGRLAGTTPQGAPLTGDPLITALPDGGAKLASAADIQALTTALLASNTELVAATSDVNSENADTVAASITQMKRELVDAINNAASRK